MRKRTRYSLLAVALLLIGLAVVVYLRQQAPPEVARLLPESDAIVYLNLKPLREATHFDRGPVTRSPAYQQFIDATGIVAERDLDRAAFALHRMSDPTGPNGAVAFSEVFEGHFDSARLIRYLAANAKAQESYAGRTIYSIPSENRTLRVVLLAYDTVAASNMPTPEQIHSIVDRQKAAASPFSGSSLLEARYRDVPPFALAWGIGHVGLPFSASGDQHGNVRLLGVDLPLPADSTYVASLRLTGALESDLHLAGGEVAMRIDEIAGSPAEAAQSAQSLTSMIDMLRAVELARQPVPVTAQDKVMREFSDSVKIVQKQDRASLTASIPVSTLRQLSGPAR
jgi:hypothetical protein